MGNESEIAEQLRDQWKDLLPHVRLLRMQNDSPLGFGGGYDLLVDIQVGDVRRQLACELKSVGEPRYLHQAISQLKTVLTGRDGTVPVVVAPHISEEGQRLLH